MATYNSTTTLAPDLKIDYANASVNLVPSMAILQQFRSKNAPGFDGKKESNGAAVSVPIDWTQAEALGRYFLVPIKTSSGQEGFTYLGTASTGDSLNTPSSLTLAECQVQGVEINNRQRITYKSYTTGGSAGKKAIESIAELVIDDIKDVAFNRIEEAALFGSSELGEGVILSQTNSTTTLTVVFTVATFCPTLWVANIGAPVQFYSISGSTPTQNMAGATNYAVVQSVDVSTRTVVFYTYNSSGTLTDWADTTVPDVGNVAYFKGSVTSGTDNLTTGSKTQIGLYTQLTATSGTIFNVNRATYTLLQGQTYAVGSVPLTKAAVVKAAMKCVDKGNTEDMVLLVGTAAWADLAAEDMALRMFDSSYSERSSKSGSEELVYTAVNGKIRVVCHPFMKQGYAFLFTPGHVSWIGSSDVTFKIDGKQLWDLVPNTNAAEIQCFADKQIFHDRPSQGIVLTGIVSSS